jgi:hypothetical protein
MGRKVLERVTLRQELNSSENEEMCFWELWRRLHATRCGGGWKILMS